MQDKITTSEFCNKLREMGKALAGGEERIELPLAYMYANIEDYEKLTLSYMRTIVNRVPEVKMVGRVRIKSLIDDDGMEYYEFSLMRSPKKVVITENEIPALKAKITRDIVEKIMLIYPDLSEFKGQDLEVASKAINKMKKVVKKMMEVKE